MLSKYHGDYIELMKSMMNQILNLMSLSWEDDQQSIQLIFICVLSPEFHPINVIIFFSLLNLCSFIFHHMIDVIMFTQFSHNLGVKRDQKRLEISLSSFLSSHSDSIRTIKKFC